MLFSFTLLNSQLNKTNKLIKTSLLISYLNVPNIYLWCQNSMPDWSTLNHKWSGSNGVMYKWQNMTCWIEILSLLILNMYRFVIFPFKSLKNVTSNLFWKTVVDCKIIGKLVLLFPLQKNPKQFIYEILLSWCVKLKLYTSWLT